MSKQCLCHCDLNHATLQTLLSGTRCFAALAAAGAALALRDLITVEGLSASTRLIQARAPLGAALWPTRAQTSVGRVWFERGAWLLWFGLLCMHKTPMGGAFHDHRYLIPAFPMLAVTLADRLDGLAPRYRGRGRAAVVILIVASSLGVWSHIVAAREQPAFTGRVAWIVLALIGAGIGYWMQRRVTASSDAVRPG